VRTIVYVDGFNLYYGAVKGTPFKWLDLAALFRRVLAAHHVITEIRYYTAIVSSRPSDPDVADRQRAYLTAIQAYIPHLTVVYGHYLNSVVTAMLETPIAGQRFARVHKTEEKGSDVNLALHMLNDAWRNAYDCAVVVSNDSDLSEAMRIVKVELRKKIVLLVPGDPRIRRPSGQLRRYANKAISIAEADIAASLLPNPIPGTTIHKPPTW
jgi:uncharacterized LabA/DUF88 family protein